MPIPSRTIIKKHLVSLLRQRGQSSPAEVYKELSDFWELTDDEQSMQRAGGTLFEHEIRWAKQELVTEGIIVSPQLAGRSNWSLSEGLSVPPEAYDEDMGHSFIEGAKKEIRVNRYERNPKAREECIKIHGTQCAICGFDFSKVYGAIGDGCIHIHHVKPISEIDEQYQVNPSEDLMPVCPNCHYMIHRKVPAFTPDEVRSMLQTNK